MDFLITFLLSLGIDSFVDQWKIEFYQSPTGNPVVYDWFLQQEPKVKAGLAQIFDLLQEKGTLVGMPYIRPIANTKLYEVRIEQNKNIYRILYFAYTGRRFILLHGFQKKEQKTPQREIKLAEKRRKEFLAQEEQNRPITNKSKSRGKTKKKR